MNHCRRMWFAFRASNNVQGNRSNGGRVLTCVEATVGSRSPPHPNLLSHDLAQVGAFKI